MKNITKGLAALLTTAALGFGLGYTLPVAATAFNPKVQINSNLTRVQISSEEFALSTNEGTCLTVLHNAGSKFYKVIYEPGYLEPGRLERVWQNYNVGNDSITNAAYLSYSLMNTESSVMEEVARNAIIELVDVADGVNPVTHVEKYRVYADIAGYRLLAAESELATGPSMDTKCYAGDKRVKATEVRMRARPNTNCDILGYFNQNEYVKVLGYINGEGDYKYPGNWAYVRRDNGAEGFIAAQFLATGPVVEDLDQFLKDHLNNSGKYESWKGLNYQLVTKDTYCGEGPRAKATKVIKVVEIRDGRNIDLAVFHVSDDGMIGKEVGDYIVADN